MKPHQRTLPKRFGRPAEALASVHQPWQKVVAGSQSLADPTANNGKTPCKDLKEALKLQKRLRRLVHQVFAAQEVERMKISHELHDEIGQSLLGINVRLLLLKQAARSKSKGLKNQIGSAQQLVVESATVVRQLACEIENHQPTASELAVMGI